MAEHQYLSIGEVLGLLLEDFPDVTISKIRFLESQGLIEPERTPSGYRKFYDSDVELLRAILHEQKANFLPLKVIRDRIESGAIESDTTGGRTPPRGIRNVELHQRHESQQRDAETRDSVFRRTDGGPEWAGGHALIPGAPVVAGAGLGTPFGGSRDGSSDGSSAPITTAVPVVPGAPPKAPTTVGGDARPRETLTVATPQKPGGGSGPPRPPEPATGAIEGSPTHPQPAPAPSPDPSVPPGVESGQNAGESPSSPPPGPKREPSQPVDRGPGAGSSRAASSRVASSQVQAPASTASAGSGAVRELPYNREELCKAAGITAAQLADLEDFAIITPRGSGVDASFQPEAVEIARIAGQLLGQGIDARHLRAWRQAAERESALFEQRIMPLLRQRNPLARQSALNSLAELSGLGARLHDALVDSLLRHHFDG